MKEMLTNYLNDNLFSNFKKNNREDVDYESIINNIFTTYLLNIEVSYKKYMYFCKAFL